ncbi:hypothetical protein MAP00_003104 [Monascus purpureus]|nr:hypothetical protein MAP00_003104 [Monascus purpureus]
MWIINVIYMQSYTVYASMLIIPYTRNSWRVKGSILFIITAWWVQSWAWYTISGLILADMVINMGFKAKAQRGIPIPILKKKNVYVPVWIPYIILMAAGLFMQLVWTGWKPQKVSAEITVHAGLYYTGGLNNKYDLSEPQARDDIYLILVGVFLAVDTYDWLQLILRNPVFVYLGTRSLSWFFAQGIIIYTAGIKLFLHLTTDKQWSKDSATGLSLIVCLSAVIVLAEVFYRLVDYPCRAMSYRVFDWIRE